MRHRRRLFTRGISPWRPTDRGHALWGRITRRLQKAAYDAIRATTAKRAAMIATAAERRGTRKRSIPMIAVGLIALGAMFGAVSRDALAVNFTTSNDGFVLYSNYLQGESAAAFLSENTSQDGADAGVAEFGIVTAKLAGLCAIAAQDMPAIGPVSLMIIAGEPVQGSFSGTAVPEGVTLDGIGGLSGTSLDSAITASNLFVNADSLGGYGNQISGLNLGQSADTVGPSAGLEWPTGQTAPTPGAFGLYADRLNVAGLDTQTHGVNLQGQITLPKLQLKVFLGTKTQADCPTEAAS